MTYETKALNALGDPTRRAIFERLADHPSAVGELARAFPVSRPAVSQHLKALKDAGLVVDRPDGNRRIYQVDPDGVAALREYLDQFWSRSLAAFKQAVEEPKKEISMSAGTVDTAVRSWVEVGAPVDRAFRVFTEQIGTWWDPTHHLLEGELAEMVFEPFAGGNVYDRGVDGSECRWAHVLAYEPPHRFVISWDVNPHWKLETDAARTSEVEVRFTEHGPDRVLVELEHRHLERHGEGWQQMRDTVASPGGWPAGMRAFAERLEIGAATYTNHHEAEKEPPCTQS